MSPRGDRQESVPWWRLHALGAAALAVLLGLAPLAPSSAGADTQGTSTSSSSQPRATFIEAHVMGDPQADVLGAGGATPPYLLTAHLWEGEQSHTGKLEGKTIHFLIGQTVVCTATTNAQGQAQCSATEAANAVGIVTGFVAEFRGDEMHLASADRWCIEEELEQLDQSCSPARP